MPQEQGSADRTQEEDVSCKHARPPFLHLYIATSFFRFDDPHQFSHRILIPDSEQISIRSHQDRLVDHLGNPGPAKNIVNLSRIDRTANGLPVISVGGLP